MSSFSEKLDGMVWSHSRVTSYAQCPYSFYLKYIVNNDDLYLSEGNFYADSGLFVHKIHEMMYKGEISPRDTLLYFIEEFENNVFYTAKESIMDRNFELCAAYFRESDLMDWLKPFEIIGVEEEIRTNLVDERGKNYPFIGFIDLAIRNKETGDIYIIDHKSSKYPFKKDGKSLLKQAEKDFEKYKHQMYLYAKYIYEKYGKYPKKLMWNHFKDQKVAAIDFDENELAKSIKWYIDTIHEIENDETFEAKEDFFYCKNLCAFRNSCEYAKGGDV